MEIIDIGQELKAERERQGLSVEKVHKDTKIGHEFIESLENGIVEQLSHPVYAKGFVQNYARYLGLDWKKIGDDFSRIYQAEDQFKKYTINDCPTSLKATCKKNDLAGYIKALIIIMALIIIIGFGWFMYTSLNPEVAETSLDQTYSDPAPASDVPEPESPYFGESPEEIFPDEEENLEQEIESIASEIPDEDLLEATEEELTNLENEVLTESESIQNNPEPVSELSQESEPSSEIIQNSNEDTTVSEPSGSILEIRAREDCWLTAEVDNSTREVYLRPGQNIQLNFEETIMLTLGNAGGVDILLDGNPYPFEAVSGEVKTIEIQSPRNNQS